jgi:hypothetical protein
MRRPSFGHVATLAALALTGVASAAACGSELLSPLPIQTPSQSTTTMPGHAAVTTPSASTLPTGVPPRVKASASPTLSRTSTCWGAIRYDLDLATTELALVRPMCFRTGGILRLQGIGPGLVTAEPASLVDKRYEAGVVDIAFVRPGTVTVTIPQDEQTYTITVVVNT